MQGKKISHDLAKQLAQNLKKVSMPIYYFQEPAKLEGSDITSLRSDKKGSDNASLSSDHMNSPSER